MQVRVDEKEKTSEQNECDEEECFLMNEEIL